LILCDDSPSAQNAAWNLLIEAEHGENSTAMLVTHSTRLASDVASRLPALIDELAPVRRAYASTVLRERGGILLTGSLDESIAFANRFAAEHVALMVRDPWSVRPKLCNAGEIVYGDFPIISLANYAMGMNAILPTSRMATSHSPISVRDFLKVTSLGFCTREGFKRLSRVVSRFSRDEGFSAHHLAVERWFEADSKSEPNEDE
jgi:histidinol dehydrogenase